MRILIIEDNEKLSKNISTFLKRHDFVTDTALDGDVGLYYALKNIYDVIILDWLLPYKDGISILHTIRKNGIHTPVIMVTALGELSDKVKGFETGADDYLVKPFALEELLVRIQALLRRPSSLSNTSTLSYSDIVLDTLQKKLICNDLSCELSKKETALFELFIHNKEQVLTRELIIDKIWGPENENGTGNLDNFMSFLRRRLRSVKSTCKISTIHGVGYRLEMTK